MDSLTAESCTDAEKRVSGNPFYEGVFVSADHPVTALMIDLPGIFNEGSDSPHRQFYSEFSKFIVAEEERTGRRFYAGGDIITDSSIEELMDRDISLFFPLELSASKFIGDFGIMAASAIASALLGDLFISPIVLLKSRLFLNKAGQKSSF
ncbi:MAG: hypothetical protein JW801_10805 [Bacteroidales bacterium]|nr:hypothetical protein [Bacteroidales bacterium]